MKKSKWMWYAGDFEIYHTMLLNNRREHRDSMILPMWRVDAPHPEILLYKTAQLEHEEKLTVHTNGVTMITVNNKERYLKDTEITLPAGRCFVKIQVFRDGGLPCVYCEGDTFASDESWMTGTYSDSGDFPVGTSDMYTELTDDPCVFKFSYERIYPESIEDTSEGILYDFGKETFGCLVLENISVSEPVLITYGESREEALDYENSMLTDTVSPGDTKRRYPARAMRYVFAKTDSPGRFKLSCDYEYIPLEYKGSFRSGDELVDRIWDTAAYTLHLNTRECYLDGIKRDRWAWSGDAYQSYFVNYYLANDRESVKRTIIGLRGNDPIGKNINTILDYSPLWIMSVYEYYFYTGDIKFLSFIYPKMVSMCDFLRTRRDENGLICGIKGDWTFIDWAPYDREGPVCAEQFLLCRALECMAKTAEALGLDGSEYRADAGKLTENINRLFWDEEKGAFIDSYVSGKRNVTRHANIFALLFSLTDERRRSLIVENVIKNREVPAITTPYFEFFELDAMCALGEFGYFTDMLRSYWGGMIKLGATTFWEAYEPSVSGADHLRMYGNLYGKSLCHAWGASPIYLLGKYTLGVRPTSPGYATFEVRPEAMGFKRFEGTVPAGEGIVSVSLTGNTVTVRSSVPGGTLIFGGKSVPIPADGEITVAED